MGIDKDNDKLVGFRIFKPLIRTIISNGWRLLLSDILYNRHKIELIFSDYLEINKKLNGEEIKKYKNPVWLQHNNQDKFFVSNDNRTISLEGKQQFVCYIEAHFGSNHIDSYT